MATLGMSLVTSAITSSPICGEFVSRLLASTESISPSEMSVPLTRAIAPDSVSERPEPRLAPAGTST